VTDTTRAPEATRLGGVPIPFTPPSVAVHGRGRVAAGTILVSVKPQLIRLDGPVPNVLTMQPRPPTEVHGGLRHRPRSAPFATSSAVKVAQQRASAMASAPGPTADRGLLGPWRAGGISYSTSGGMS
jgi:hypothetical protein